MEGHSEFYSLGIILNSLRGAYGHTILKPLYAPIQPKASYDVIARACKSRIGILESKNVDRIIVLLDREDREACPAEMAGALVFALKKLTSIEVLVVIKNRCYENWLIADLKALRDQPKRYKVSKNSEKSVVPNKADNVEALKLLKSMCINQYDKVEDSKKIAKHATASRIASNSRSFRRLMRCVEHHTYKDQSKIP